LQFVAELILGIILLKLMVPTYGSRKPRSKTKKSKSSAGKEVAPEVTEVDESF
jgi:hypothetical protein